jgi:hypothetical protein
VPAPPMPPEVLKEALDLVARHGSVTKASRATGIPRGTLESRLSRAKAEAANPRSDVCSLREPGDHKFTERGDEATLDAIVRGPVRTLAQLLEVCGVDGAVWEVRDWSSTAWTTAMKLEVREGGKIQRAEPYREQNYRVTARFRRKTPREMSLASLLEDIKANAPLLPNIKRPKPRKLAVRRALEVDIMDPHLGLLCGVPESDAPWDLDLAAGTIMQALDDLIAKASAFGPFEQVFMPFGNDFVHSDTILGTTTAGTPQPESISWHRVFVYAERVAIAMVERLRKVAPEVYVYEVPGNHSSLTDFTLARLIAARFHACKGVTVDASASPYKFHRYGVNLIGFEHGHSVAAVRLAALMSNERPMDAAQTSYKEWHLGDQHRKGSSKPSMLEEQGVSIEYVPGLTAPNEWHRRKSFNHQQRGAMAYVWDYHTGPVGRFQFNILKYLNQQDLSRN